MLSTTVNKVILNGNGVTTIWPYTFPIPDTASLVVTYTDTAGVETVLGASLFSVTGIGTPAGGNVTYPLNSAAIAVGTKLTIARIVGYTQDTLFSTQGSYDPSVTELRFDRVYMAIQQLAEKIARALVGPISDSSTIGALPSATARANTVLGFDASGNPYAAVLTTSIVAVSSFIATTFLNAANAAAARLAIGIPATGADGTVLTASSGATSGIAWSPHAPGKSLTINGDFAIDQRNAGASKTLTAAAARLFVTVDRYYANCTGANITVQRVTGTAPNPFALRFTGATSNTGGVLGTPYESSTVAHLVSQSVVNSVWIKSSTLTSITWTAYSANSTDNFNGGRTSIATGTISGITSTLTQFNFTFNAGANAANGIEIEYSFGALVAGQTLQFENDKLEAGTIVTAFERKVYREREMDCFRYCFRRQATAANQLGIAGGGFQSNIRQDFPDHFPVPMRIAPAGAISSAGDFQIAANNSTLAATSLGAVTFDRYGAFLTTQNGSYTSGFYGSLTSANSSAWIQYDAEITI